MNCFSDQVFKALLTNVVCFLIELYEIRLKHKIKTKISVFSKFSNRKNHTLYIIIPHIRLWLYVTKGHFPINDKKEMMASWYPGQVPWPAGALKI